MKKQLFIFLLLTIPVSLLAQETNEPVWRDYHWGMSEAEVRDISDFELETAEPDGNLKTIAALEITVGDYNDIMLILNFQNDSLYSISFISLSENTTGYIRYNRLLDIFKQKYGDTREDAWQFSPYERDDWPRYHATILNNNGGRTAEWEISDNLKLTLFLTALQRNITAVKWTYSDPTVSDEIEQAEEQATIDDF